MKRAVVVVAAVVVALLAYLLLFSGPEVVNREPTGQNIICFGDSLTVGTGATLETSYPAQLAGLIGQPIINAGVPGDTTASAMVRLDEDVLSLSPRIVLITLGGNDLMGGVPTEEAFGRLQTIVQRIQDRGALVVVGGIEAPIYGRGFADAYEQLCAEAGCVLIDNVFKGIMGKKDLMSDRIHPNADGYAVMARHFEKAIKPYL